MDITEFKTVLFVCGVYRRQQSVGWKASNRGCSQTPDTDVGVILRCTNTAQSHRGTREYRWLECWQHTTTPPPPHSSQLQVPLSSSIEAWVSCLTNNSTSPTAAGLAKCYDVGVLTDGPNVWLDCDGESSNPDKHDHRSLTEVYTHQTQCHSVNGNGSLEVGADAPVNRSRTQLTDNM